jgi:hypothetical protein
MLFLKSKDPAALIRRLQSPRAQPSADVRACFGLPGTPHKPLTLNARLGALRFLSKLCGFFGEAIFERVDFLTETASLHGYCSIAR